MNTLFICTVVVGYAFGHCGDTCFDQDADNHVDAISLLQKTARVITSTAHTGSSSPRLVPPGTLVQKTARVIPDHESRRHLGLTASRVERTLTQLVPFATATISLPLPTNGTAGSSPVEVPVGAIFIRSLTAVAQAVSMALIGLIAARFGFINDNARKVLSTISMNITIPCLLFSNILACPQGGPDQNPALCPDLATSLTSAWPFLLFPFAWVAIGSICGRFAAIISGAPEDLRSTIVAACAFGNSTGVPLVLFTAISQAGIVSGGLSAIEQERQLLLLLSVYQIAYPPIQWISGTLLLKEPQGSRKSNALLKPGLEDAEDEPSILERCGALVKVALTPPVVAVILGAVVGLVKPLRNLLVDYHTFNNDMPLEWGFNAVELFGQAAVPMNMMILGASLANIPSWSSIHLPSTLSTAFCKLVICPAVAFGVMAVLVLSGEVRDLVPDAALRSPFVLVACILAATPTANNLMVMAETYAGKDSKQALSSSIFVMYCFAPFTLTAWIVAFCALGQYV